MKVIVLATQKGGSGKTTLAAHIACAADADGLAVAVVDADPQGGLNAWWNARGKAEHPALLPGHVRELAKKLPQLEAAGIGLLVIDTPPGVSSELRRMIGLASLVVVPVRPSPHDIRAVAATVAVARELARPFLFVMNAARSWSSLLPQTVALLSKHGPVAETFVHDRQDFAASMADGRTALDFAPKGLAAQETHALWQGIKSTLGIRKGKK